MFNWHSTGLYKFEIWIFMIDVTSHLSKGEFQQLVSVPVGNRLYNISPSDVIAICCNGVCPEYALVLVPRPGGRCQFCDETDCLRAVVTRDPNVLQRIARTVFQDSAMYFDTQLLQEPSNSDFPRGMN